MIRVPFFSTHYYKKYNTNERRVEREGQEETKDRMSSGSDWGSVLRMREDSRGSTCNSGSFSGVNPFVFLTLFCLLHVPNPDPQSFAWLTLAAVTFCVLFTFLLRLIFPSSTSWKSNPFNKISFGIFSWVFVTRFCYCLRIMSRC